MSNYPEHDKLAKISDQSQTIGGFLDWAQGQGWHLAEWDDSREYDDRMMPIELNIEQVLAAYFDIDLNRLHAEKQAIYESLREAANLMVEAVAIMEPKK